MNKSFEQLLNESFSGLTYNLGSVVKATVVNVGKDFVLVDAGLKSECAIPVEQFQ
ncbi:MAG: S1 RNA-binding domain-containing protein, partial [Gammaproteobacteria bacterium]|nr:S1 RNA-binding domain-containing protein [Gammaproteobacteria bacterium]